MASNKTSFFYSCYGAFFSTLFFIYSCASVQKPQGGPRDKTPPKLLKATPENKSKRFVAKQIVLDFDEYFKLNNQYQEITISPAQEKLPEFRIRQKSLVINLKDSLRKNTTYVISFGKAIGDVNENNILKNFTYVFTTGTEIDSLSISGKVINSETQLPEKEVTAFIFTAKQDSALFGKKKPSYYATTDTAGNFKISNLHANTYRIYAIKEASPNRILDNENELIALLPKDIQLRKDTANILLTLFKPIPAKFRVIDRKIDADGKLSFTFNKGIERPELRIIQNENLNAQKIVEFSRTADSARLYLRDMGFDSIKVAILSGSKALDTVTLRKGKRETFKRNLSISNTATGGLLKPKTNLQLTANYPIESTNEAQITLAEDSVPKYGITLDKDTSLLRSYVLKYPWKAGKHYDVVLNEGTFIDIYGNKNRKTNISFQLNKDENYGSMVYKVVLPDTSKAYIFELLNFDKKPIKSIHINRNQSLSFNNYAIAKYYVRIIYDLNKNGKWDTGNIKNRTLPEPIWYYNKEFSLRANWEMNETIEVPKPVTNP
ncbi:MAG: Ig-like domain-containing protein [Mucilaginibacter sp.]|uniref:Ig-like domain-containing protein n=1 Tax=Mucilaginibacter sp. TaxID=1882438 RepID=UPI0034E48886